MSSLSRNVALHAFGMASIGTRMMQSITLFICFVMEHKYRIMTTSSLIMSERHVNLFDRHDIDINGRPSGLTQFHQINHRPSTIERVRSFGCIIKYFILHWASHNIFCICECLIGSYSILLQQMHQILYYHWKCSSLLLVILYDRNQP